jgi:hypothetical protein
MYLNKIIRKVIIIKKIDNNQTEKLVKLAHCTVEEFEGHH